MAKTTTHVHICIWETRGNDTCVFVAKTKKRLYEAVWNTIKDYWDEVVTQYDSDMHTPPKNPSKAIDIYAEYCNMHELGEYFSFLEEEVL